MRRNTPRTRGKRIVGKKSERSRLTTTSRPTCGSALLNVDRSRTNPWAGASTGSFSRIEWSTHCCAVASVLCGAESTRSPPERFGTVKFT